MGTKEVKSEAEDLLVKTLMGGGGGGGGVKATIDESKDGMGRKNVGAGDDKITPPTTAPTTTPTGAKTTLKHDNHVNHVVGKFDKKKNNNIKDLTRNRIHNDNREDHDHNDVDDDDDDDDDEY